MALSEEIAAVSDDYSFCSIVDVTCEKLMERQIRYSIRRIQEMEKHLSDIEQELDDFILTRLKFSA